MCPLYFNPRSREGSDNGSLKVEIPMMDFNPRSREGSDPMAPPEPSPTGYFNPRSREGSDARSAGRKQRAPQFQSTLP